MPGLQALCSASWPSWFASLARFGWVEFSRGPCCLPTWLRRRAHASVIWPWLSSTAGAGRGHLLRGVRMRGDPRSERVRKRFLHRLVSTTVLAFSSFSLPAPAVAQGWTFDAPELARFAADYERLRDSGEATNDPSLAARVAYFNGFVLGVARANADRGWYCLPTEAVAGQTWDAVATFLREHPELLDRRPSTLVNGALAKGFPCAERPAPAKKPTAKPKPKPSAGAKPSR